LYIFISQLLYVKNSAPHAAEAFKAVGLAYATLSDPQKRSVYDRYGDEDPDNRGGGMASHMRHGGGQEVSPEDIFNAFFGGGMPGGVHMGGGPGGVHFYSTGFGPGGLHFRGGQARRPRTQGQQQPQNEQQAGFGMLLQMLPVLLFILLSFLSTNEHSTTSTVSKGEGQYFSLEVRSIRYNIHERVMRGRIIH
jgi:DnaJ homolog subfamily B member 12